MTTWYNWVWRYGSMPC